MLCTVLDSGATVVKGIENAPLEYIVSQGRQIMNV